LRERFSSRRGKRRSGSAIKRLDDLESARGFSRAGGAADLPDGQISLIDLPCVCGSPRSSQREKGPARKDEIREMIQFDRGRQIQSVKNFPFRKSKIVHILAHPAST
jgi:hypothetical protein